MLSICYQIEPQNTSNAPFMRVLRILFLFKLGKFIGASKHFCLVFVLFMPTFYFIYTYYFDLLIFCCQNVATNFVKFYKYLVLFILNQVLLFSSIIVIDLNFAFSISLFAFISNSSLFLYPSIIIFSILD